jgi:hypothetical protein
MNTVKVITRTNSSKIVQEYETTQQPEQVRIRVNFTVSTKGMFQADITSEAETIATAFDNLNKTIDEMEAARKMMIATGKLGVKE